MSGDDIGAWAGFGFAVFCTPIGLWILDHWPGKRKKKTTVPPAPKWQGTVYDNPPPWRKGGEQTRSTTK